MICQNCEQEAGDLWTCDICGNEVCEDCSVDEGNRIDDIQMICISCLIKRR